MGIPGGSVVKNPPAKSGDLLPESGRSPGEGNSNPLQYSCLDRGSWGGYSPWGHTRVGHDLTTKQQLPLDCKQRFSLLCSLLCLQWPAKQYLMRAQIILSLFARPLKHAFGWGPRNHHLQDWLMCPHLMKFSQRPFWFLTYLVSCGSD